MEWDITKNMQEKAKEILLTTEKFEDGMEDIDAVWERLENIYRNQKDEKMQKSMKKKSKRDGKNKLNNY